MVHVWSCSLARECLLPGCGLKLELLCSSSCEALPLEEHAELRATRECDASVPEWLLHVEQLPHCTGDVLMNGGR